MRLTKIGNSCADNKICPTRYLTDRGTVVLQGYQLASADLAGMGLPDGETAVEIPLAKAREWGIRLDDSDAHSG